MGSVVENATSGVISFNFNKSKIDLENVKELFCYIYSPIRQSISYSLKSGSKILAEGELKREWNLLTFDCTNFENDNINDLTISLLDLSRASGLTDFKITNLFVNGSLGSTSNY